MASIVSIAEVRAVTGAPSTLIDDSTVQSLLDLVQAKTIDTFEIALTPTKKIETLTGEYKNKIMVEEYFPLTVYKVVNGSTELNLKNVYVDSENGFLEIYGDSIASGFPYASNRFSHYDIDVKVKYLYGVMQRDNSITTDTTAIASSGNSVSIEVVDSSSFTVNDYVFIEDTNRAKEVFKITAIADATHITAEILVNDYESGAIVTKAKTHEIIKQYMLYETAVGIGMNAIGSTYTFNTSYNVEGVQATRGVPYPHWEKNTNESIKRRDELLGRIRKLLGIIV